MDNSWTRGESEPAVSNWWKVSLQSTHWPARPAYLRRRVLRRLVLRQPLVLQHMHERRLARVVQSLQPGRDKSARSDSARLSSTGRRNRLNGGNDGHRAACTRRFAGRATAARRPAWWACRLHSPARRPPSTVARRWLSCRCAHQEENLGTGEGRRGWGGGAESGLSVQWAGGDSSARSGDSAPQARSHALLLPQPQRGEDVVHPASGRVSRQAWVRRLATVAPVDEEAHRCTSAAPFPPRRAAYARLRRMGH